MERAASLAARFGPPYWQPVACASRLYELGDYNKCLYTINKKSYRLSICSIRFSMFIPS